MTIFITSVSREMANAQVSDHKKFEIAVASALDDCGDDGMVVKIISQGLCYRCQKKKHACKCKCNERFCPDIYGEYRRTEKGWIRPFVADCKHYVETTSLSRKVCEKIVRDRDQMKRKIEMEQNERKANRLKGFIIYTPGKISPDNRTYLKNNEICVIEVNSYGEADWEENLREDFRDSFA